ncbi:MAG: glycosyltransferase family 4 protein [Saprospiraceae bacterium]|nr:glycosyltransferase family 4 protein [Saprospiraceae bacterium]
MYRFAFSRIKKLIVYNRDDLDVFVRNKIVTPEKCSIVPGSGVNTNQFRPLSKGKTNDAFVFLFIGRLLHDKGLQEFVEAAKLLAQQNKRIECWVVGNFTFTNPSAIQKEELFEWVENGYIHYIGFAKDVRSHLKNADVMVLPSHRGEGVPRSILEAMSMKKPIITTETAGCRDTVVHGQNGYLVPVGDAASLADAMALLYESSANDLEAMGDSSRKRAIELFDEKIIASRFAAIVREVLPITKNESAGITSPAVL